MTLPKHLKNEKHWDWPWPLSLVPRRWTAWEWGTPEQLAGSQELRRKGPGGELGPAPIGERGSWQLAYYPDAPWWAKPVAWYVAATLPGGRHFRVGARWDDVDGYVQWPAVASRRYSGDPLEDTGTR